MKFTIFLLLTFVSSIMIAQGQLDLGFGDQGKVITQFGDYSAEVAAVQVQSDGKILLAGNGEGPDDEKIFIVRYLPQGELDLEFGVDGIVELSFFDLRNRCFDLVIDDVGSILLTGSTSDGTFTNGYWFLMKLHSNGEIDESFAQNGIWTSEESGLVSIVLQSDEKIVVSGTFLPMGQGSNNTSTIHRFNTNGSLDLGFGENGISIVEIPFGYIPTFVELNSTEEIIVGGFLLETYNVNTMFLKFNQEGIIDDTFGNNGILVDETFFEEYARSMIITDDDKMLVAKGVTIGSNRDFGLAKYNSNGTLDTNFGINGRVTTDFLNSSNNANAISLQEDGKIILGGFLGITPNHDYAIARYDELGNLDQNFGGDGKVITDLGLDDLMLLSTIQADGKLLCVGDSKTDTGFSSFSMSRYFTTFQTNTFELGSTFENVSVFPNPTNGQLSISIELENAIDASINIFNIEGKLIQTVVDNHKFSNGNNFYDFQLNNNLPEGIYNITIETKTGEVLKKFIFKN